MTDPRALLDAYAEEIVDIESDFGVFEPIKRADAAGAMLAALRAVLDLADHYDDLGDRMWTENAAEDIRGAITALLPEVQPPPPPQPPPPEPSRCYWSGGVQVHVKPWCRCGKWPWIPIAWGDESH